jgi:hypothetical protein
MLYMIIDTGEIIMSTKYDVEYFESERGWGTDTWITSYDTEEEALAEVEKTNSKYLGQSITPDYYIRATYLGISKK